MRPPTRIKSRSNRKNAQIGLGSAAWPSFKAVEHKARPRLPVLDSPSRCAPDAHGWPYHAITHGAFRVAPALSVLLKNAVKSRDSSRPRAPVAKTQFPATLAAVFRNGGTRHRSDNETEF